MFVGGFDAPLQALLEDVLEVELIHVATNPDLVFAIVGLRDPFRVLSAARVAAAGQAPVIALLPLADYWLARRAVIAGATVCWPLNGSLQTLQEVIGGLVSGLARVEP